MLNIVVGQMNKFTTIDFTLVEDPESWSSAWLISSPEALEWMYRFFDGNEFIRYGNALTVWQILYLDTFRALDLRCPTSGYCLYKFIGWSKYS